MTPEHLHEQAMEVAENAFFARREGDDARFLDLCVQALSLEEQAARCFESDVFFEPTRSVLFRSAATLATWAGNTTLAVDLANIALKGTPPREIREELAAILRCHSQGALCAAYYHSQYYAYELTKQCSAHQIEKLSKSIFNATVDLNPHQIDAALFAFRSPLSRGAILADEVGLGKTIEAGFIVSQLWAERRRRILCIVPAALRKQWQGELCDKFFIESLILESKTFNRCVKDGISNPFDQRDMVVICSYHFARNKETEVAALPWDLVVIDEAHRLRNVYKKSNKIARTLKNIIGMRPKVLLTATPLQNSLMELYGLVSFVDPHVFGSEDSFRDQFARRSTDMSAADFQSLRARISPVCQRTLRKQVTEYIRYTNRVSLTQDFTPTDDEVKLYEAVSEYLQRPDAFALPAGQRSLMTLVLRKILASSSFAIAATLGRLIERLDAMHEDVNGAPTQESAEGIMPDYELTEEMQDEWSEDNGNAGTAEPSAEHSDNHAKQVMAAAIRDEIKDLAAYKELAESITHNAKGEALRIALKTGFEKLNEFSAPLKALIFTESRRTQRYLYELLENNGYSGQLVMLNGTNTEQPSREVYKRWVQRHEGHDCVTGSRAVDMRTALLEEFRDHASIMISTESGAEGLNLQFCCLVVNYDLPWNPQRIEQRIGRCHRYGQKHDVVVINFLNRRNAADQRVFELLSEKLRLFDGVFGASDEILGALESGVDFEKRISGIYQSCRTAHEINTAFDQLQRELDEKIQSKMTDARSKLFEHFDEDVHDRLRLSREHTMAQVGRFEKWLWKLTEIELSGCAIFSPDEFTFELQSLPDGFDSGGIPLGQYRFVTQRKDLDGHQYRLGHPLAQQVIQAARTRQLPCCEVEFLYEEHPGKISVLQQLIGQSGWLRLFHLSVQAFETEEHILPVAITDDGTVIDADVCRRLFSVRSRLGEPSDITPDINAELEYMGDQAQNGVCTDIATRNRDYFELEMEKLDHWAEDLKTQLETELKGLDKEIKATKRDARQAVDLEAKVVLHRKVKNLEKERTDKRRRLFDAQDEVDSRKDDLITDVETRLKQQVRRNEMFTIRWRIT